MLDKPAKLLNSHSLSMTQMNGDFFSWVNATLDENNEVLGDSEVAKDLERFRDENQKQPLLILHGYQIRTNTSVSNIKLW